MIDGAEYDRFPYDGRPQSHTHPQHTQTVARLFGVDTPDPRQARVLELGCAEGANLIPMACSYPEANFVGIDYSKRQIEEGQRIVTALELNNITLKAKSILDIDDSWGQFDYIICNGIYSWVPEEVRTKIMAVCQANLTPDGIALINYNTLPGWNFIKPLRDMMLYHSRDVVDPAQKVSKARHLINFLSQESSGLDTIYGQVIAKEAKVIAPTRDAYVLHEYLESENQPFYFHEFIDQARRHGLTYLGDSSIPTMYQGSLPPNIQAMLASSTDGEAVEQYMDFFQNRRFRTTLLAHASRAFSREIKAERIENFLVRSNLKFSKTVKGNDGQERLEFSGPPTVTAETPEMAGLLSVLADHHLQAIPVQELYRLAVERVEGTTTESIRREFVKNGMLLTLLGALAPMTDAGAFVTDISDRPVACPLVRHQASQVGATWVTSRRHETVSASPEGMALLCLLDGSRDFKALCKKLRGTASPDIITRFLGIAAEAALLID